MIDHAINQRGSEVEVLIFCKICDYGDETILMTQKQYQSWVREMSNAEDGVVSLRIQDIFPELPRERREILISQTCSGCFDRFTGWGLQ